MSQNVRRMGWLPTVTRICFVIGVFLQIAAVTGGALWWNGYLRMQVTQPNEVDVHGQANGGWFGGSQSQRRSPSACHPSLPTAIPVSSQEATSLPFRLASRRLHLYLKSVMTLQHIDSLTVGVVAPNGLIFERSYGYLRANETEEHGARTAPDTDSLYRIASISKMFCALELMVLKQKGVLGWDDPVDRFLTNFTYNNGDWRDHLYTNGDAFSASPQSPPPITLRQLASHMSGVGRDLPPILIKSWPKIDPVNISVEIRTKEAILKSISNLPLVVPQYSLPVYSNTGFALLGWTLTAAANTTSTYADLVHRDVFEPLNLSSSFNVTNHNAHRIVVPSTAPEMADMDGTDAMNSAGGQYSSLRDLETVMKTFLVPSRSDSLLSPYSMREWLRPLHPFSDDLTEIGAPWEIRKIIDSYGRPRRWYGKGGNLLVYQSKFNFSPEAGFGVVVLMSGQYQDSEAIGLRMVEIYQAAFDHHIAHVMTELYAGQWVSEDKKSEAVTTFLHGGLWVVKMVLNGTDIIKMLAGPVPVSQGFGLWSTGKEDEFRVGFGRGGVDGNCFPIVASLDPFYARDAPVDLVLFEGAAPERVMKVPSVGGELRRRGWSQQ
ncbi:hypothetical protein FRB98_008334 [Tulasnella sp. 332]|nr:hypothetical protein FRB98_008334 [Tulasnella sp. 332]